MKNSCLTKYLHALIYSKYFKSFFLKYQSRFRKWFSVQQYYIKRKEKSKLAVDDENTYGALLTDL